MRMTADSCPTTSFPLTISGQELLKESLKKKKTKKGESQGCRQREGATYRNSTVNSDGHLETDHPMV